MTETPKVAPALTSEQWAARIVSGNDFPRYPDPAAPPWDGVPYIFNGEFGVSAETYFCDVPPAEAIALANAALPDSDPRKITRGRIALLRHAWALSVGNMGGDEAPDARALDEFIAALESYLPPTG